MKAVAIVSGGLDSVIMLYDQARHYDYVHVVTFTYGQSNAKEIYAAERAAIATKSNLSCINLSLGGVFRGRALLDKDTQVPREAFNDENAKQIFVPARNAIFLSIAWGIAEADKADAVMIGSHASDNFNSYPDNAQPFFDALQSTLRIGNLGFGNPDLEIIAPYVNTLKKDVVKLGSELDVPMEHTWSCFLARDRQCGACGACRERRNAFKRAGVKDLTVYEAEAD